jgi:hypothetical protein
MADDHRAQPQDGEQVWPSLQVQDSPQVQPEPQAQDWTGVEQLQDWPQLQGLPSHPLFIGSSSLVGDLDDPYLAGAWTAHLNERAKRFPALPRKFRTYAGKCG